MPYIAPQNRIIQEYREKTNIEDSQAIKSNVNSARMKIMPNEFDVKTTKMEYKEEASQKKETKPRWPVIVLPDTNYKKDKGGNHRMFLTYNRNSNEIRFFKDDDDFVVIKNDAVKSASEFHEFYSKIEEKCKQNKGYYYEDYLKDHGFIEEQKGEEIDIDELMKEIDSLRDRITKKAELLYK